MKSKIKVSVSVLLAFIFLAGAAVTNHSQNAYAAEAKGKITVSGEGRVSVSPDIAYITAGVTVQDADAKTAQNKNSEIMSKVIAAVKALGIDAKDIQTSNYSIYPQRNYTNGSGKITGYTVNNSVKITIRDISKAGEVLDKTVDAGANDGGSIQFDIADRQPYYEEALALAIKNAASKGGAIAKAIGVKVSSPVQITETAGSYMPYATMKMEASYDAAVPVETGQLTVTAGVQVVYEY